MGANLTLAVISETVIVAITEVCQQYKHPNDVQSTGNYVLCFFVPGAISSSRSLARTAHFSVGHSCQKTV